MFLIWVGLLLLTIWLMIKALAFLLLPLALFIDDLFAKNKKGSGGKTESAS